MTIKRWKQRRTLCTSFTKKGFPVARLQRLHWVSHAKNAIPMYRVDKPMMLLPKWVGQGTQAQD